MIQIRLGNRNVIKTIRDFYIKIWYDRLVNLTLRKYSYKEALQNIYKAMTFFAQTFNDNQLRNPLYPAWQRKGLKEIRYRNWHFGVIVQLDLFGNNIAIVQDCIHDKDYHNDTMHTEPFKMDAPDDLSHLVDWKERRLHTIIAETIRESIAKLV